MTRAGIPLFMVLLCLAGLLGGAIWQRQATAAAWRQGYGAGEAALAGRLAAETERARAAAEKAAQQSSIAILELEKRREALQTRLDKLNQAISTSADSARQCLDADLLRALARAGDDGANSRAGAAEPP